jgi:stalled ribosome rescue protein Dom34
MSAKKTYRRGYSVAILAGFETGKIVLWRVFSQVVKPEKTIIMQQGDWTDAKARYNQYEKMIDALRPALKEGVKVLILVSPPRTTYDKSFMEHMSSHHSWLVQGPNRVTVSTIPGSLSSVSEVAALVQTPAFKELISRTTEEEAEDIAGIIEKKLNAKTRKSLVFYSIEEIEQAILVPSQSIKPDYLLLTDKYLAESRQKNRIHRLMQIAQNRRIKTKVVNAKSTAGVRITQLGGIICLIQQS